MKRIIAALLATGLMGTALAQTAPPADPQPQTSAPTAAPAIAGAKTATTQSLGEMTPYFVIGGVVMVGAIVAASSGGNNDHASSTPPPTGTTGTH